MTKHERAMAAATQLPLLCSVARVAREFDCSKTKIYQMIAAGTLPVVTIDGMMRVRREEIEKRCGKMNSGLENTAASSSPSEDAELTSSDIRSASRLGRLARPKLSGRSAS